MPDLNHPKVTGGGQRLTMSDHTRDRLCPSMERFDHTRDRLCLSMERSDHARDHVCLSMEGVAIWSAKGATL